MFHLTHIFKKFSHSLLYFNLSKTLKNWYSIENLNPISKTTNNWEQPEISRYPPKTVFEKFYPQKLKVYITNFRCTENSLLNTAKFDFYKFQKMLKNWLFTKFWNLTNTKNYTKQLRKDLKYTKRMIWKSFWTYPKIVLKSTNLIKKRRKHNSFWK